MTTFTGYPDAHPESTCVDGYAERAGVDQTWAAIRAGAGSASGDADTNVRCAWTTASATSNQFARLRRGILLFDTSSIPVGATIDSATLTLTGVNKANTFGGTAPDLHVVGSSPASNVAVANGDYSNLSFTSFGSVSYAGFSTSGANVITLNASGLAAIVNGGITKLGLVLSWDQSGTVGGTWGSGATASFYINWADNGSNKPTLTVEYTTAGITTKQMFYARQRA